MFTMRNDIDRATYRYIDMTRRMPRLSREDEASLARRFHELHDRQAGERLLHAHLRDVVFVALKYRHYGVPISELISEGNLGLLRALEKFDPTRGVRFSTYAAHWIRANAITHVLRSRSVTSGRTGVLRSRLFFRLRRERARLEGLYGSDEKNAQLLAADLGVTEQKVARMLERLDARDVSIDAQEGSGAAVRNVPARGEDPARAYDVREARGRLEKALHDTLAELDPRERFIAESRWLADASSELTLADIGRELGVSRQRVLQLEARAKEKVRLALEKRHGITSDWIQTLAA
jgi:RNA polymerase sigma-32 factor